MRRSMKWSPSWSRESRFRMLPFAFLWKTKQTCREKDQIDCIFLRRVLEESGEWPVA